MTDKQNINLNPCLISTEKKSTDFPT